MMSGHDLQTFREDVASKVKQARQQGVTSKEIAAALLKEREKILEESDIPPCPSCGENGFTSEKAMKLHHFHAHEESLVEKETLTCEHCGGEFQARGERIDTRRYCSQDCRSADRTVTLICRHCGDDYERVRSNTEGSKYCSESCRNKAETRRTDDELLEAICEVNRLVDGRPTVEDMNELGAFGDSVYWNRFDSWSDALTRAGVDELPHRGKVGTDELLTDLKRVADEMGRVPSCNDYRKHGKHSTSACYHRFGSWYDTLEAADLSPHPYYTKLDVEYGDGWNPAKRRKVLGRDSYECAFCGMDNRAHQVTFGISLNVHHITPARELEDSTERNDITNLVSLCKYCHSRWEASCNRFRAEPP